jgi:Leucine-rich repeat (LRR) protein
MDVFTRFKQLRILSVSDISLMKTTESLTKLTNLTALILSNCSIKHLPNLSNLQRLEHLVLEGNGLSRLDGIPAVKYLALHDEFFTEIPIVKEPPRLAHLSMTNMPLKTVAPIMSFTNLETIDFSNATLKSIPTNIDKLQKLQYIDLSDNKLTHVPKSIFNLPDLELLLLDNNLLSAKDIQSIQEVFKKSHPDLILRL